MNKGGLTGVGLGKSTQKYLYLPEPYTDFIFPVLIEELGLITGIFVILLFGVILYKILAIGRKATNNGSALMCY
jgi:cell division protein FtsW